MTTLNIGGQRVRVGDDFLKFTPEQQQNAVEEIAASLPKPEPAAPAETPVGATDLVRSFGTGVPVIGGALNQLNAATNATLAPLIEPFLEKGPETLDQPTWSERRKKSLDIQNKRDEKFSKEHPITDTVAKVTGGVAGTIPMIMAAPAAFGAVGTLPQMVTRATASGFGLSAADAAVRGEDVVQGGGIGAAFSAGAPLIARGVGKAIQAFTPRTAPVVQNTVRVGDVDVPMRPDQLVPDMAASAEAEAALRGAHGEKAQGIAQQFDELQGARLREATDDLSAKLDPTGAVIRTAPQEAGERVATELADAEARRFGTQQNAIQRAALEGERVRALPSGQVDAQGAPVRTVDSPFAAAEVVGGGVQNAAQAARAARTAAYRDFAEVPGEFEPAALQRIGNSIRGRLNAGDNPVRITDTLTPRAAEALRSLDENVGTLRFQNNADTGELVLDAMGRPVPRPITGQTIDEARKELTTLYGDARRAAMGPGGSQADVRAVDRIIDAFDAHVRQASVGGFSGDAAALQAASDRARASHAAYRRTFSKQGPGDEVGAAVEKIIGRYEGQASPPDQVAQLSYGSAAEPGGAMSIKVAQRLRTIFGANSPEWGAYKQGLVAHVVDDAPGAGARTPSQVADRIEKFLDGTKGRGLAQIALTDAERTALRNHAGSLRASEPVPLSSLNDVDRIVAKISGRDGGMAATPGEVVDLLYSRTGTGSKGVSVRLAERLKRDLSPEGWTAVRQGMWSKLTNAGEGKIEFGPQALSQRIHEFLNESGKPLATSLYSAPERAQMALLAKTYKQLIQPKGTTNPSGTAWALNRMANKASNNLMAMLGAVHSGFIGAGVGMGVEKGVRGLVNAKNARAAERTFYGQQPRRAPRAPSRVPIILSQGIAPQANQ